MKSAEAWSDEIGSLRGQDGISSIIVSKIQLDAFKAGRAANWIKADEIKPEHGQRVLATYKGVYNYRLVTYWIDAGGGSHFGLPSERDGKGSQPATHWHPLPNLP